MRYNISKVAEKFGLSRSTLLYYESIGLLPPAPRSAGNYRVYGDRECRMLEQICLLRGAGVKLEAIGELVRRRSSRRAEVLAQRLEAIGAEIARLREQQRVIVGLLGERAVAGSARSVGKAQWVEMLRRAGLDEAGMDRWHAEFEKSSPEAHQDFLESLGIGAAEIRQIRAWSAKCSRG